MQQPSTPKEEATAEESEGVVDTNSLDLGLSKNDPLPPIDLPPVQDDFEVNSWGRRSLMLLDSSMRGDSPQVSSGGVSLGHKSRLSMLSPSQGPGLDDALLNGLPSSSTQNPGHERKHTSISTKASQGSGSLTESSSAGQHPQPAAFLSTSSESPTTAAPSARAAPHSKGYEFYFRALEANFRLAQAQANGDVGTEPALTSPQAPTLGGAVLNTAPTPMITEDSTTKVLPEPPPRTQARNQQPDEQQPSETTSAPASSKRNRSPTTDDNRAGRSGIKVKATKNEREQQRAQRIAELIDQIRVNIEDDGMQLEVRSKFHILSKCTEYLREAMSAAQAKEKSVHRLRAELKELQQKLEAPRTEYDESVTSSLTSSSSNKVDGIAGARTKTSLRTAQDQTAPRGGGTLKKAAEIVSLNESSNSGGGCGGGSAQRSDGTTAKATTSGSDSSTKNQRQSRDKNSETTSEMRGREDSPSDDSSVTGSAEMEVTPEIGTIVSDAAVKSQIGSGIPMSNTTSNGREKESTNSDSSSDKDVPLGEVVALERRVTLDYESVFLESNIPQLVAIPSGRIVAYNHAFLYVAGLRKTQVGRISLFSLIPLDELTALFEVLAQTMGSGGTKDNMDTPENAQDPADSPLKSDQEDAGEHVNNRTYTSITLPCVEFPLKRKQHTYQSPYPLFVTITLLDDIDAQKRCMHCVFSNHRGTNGKVGVLTSDLLQGIFSYHARKEKTKPLNSIPGESSQGEHLSQQQGMEVAFHNRPQQVVPVNREDSTADPVQSGNPTS
eukprot:Nitzschia sp. Nitz4//scaffold27_size158506//9782//12303//NITZ4_002577-RA/size158506-snap-gene-0.192-mRNA-1//1//CDS//3329545419//2201//frame0